MKLDAPVFCIDIDDDVLYTGTALGRVQAWKAGDELVPLYAANRHKGSVRGLQVLNQRLVTVGSDRVIKLADSSTGQVISKLSASVNPQSALKTVPTTVTFMNNNRIIAVGTEGGDLQVYDSRASITPNLTVPNIHGDSVSSIVPLYHSNPFQCLTSGGATVAHIDIRQHGWKRNPVLLKSENQEDELLCGTVLPGAGPTASRHTGTAGFGTASGVLTLWYGRWDDQQLRVPLSKDEPDSIDCVVPIESTMLAAGGEGYVWEVDVKSSKVLNEWNVSESVFGLAVGSNKFYAAAGEYIVSRNLSVDESSPDPDSDSTSDSNSRVIPPPVKTKRRKTKGPSSTIPKFKGLD
ncbi:hypothetical protein CANCADRAFT_2525 [Tortispora caseinolytica NRRL Y-17796]|uniref:Anaphase-promoting complex subunit 4 WD40 domain-containing protein n=1 Tax=Tortispora caseinolytica NRRL Y-17796 TaxID=767744 RepID=A0A1E4TGF1_9ASCO|nr:hypothetical protein CANCADRAFT_2525 [Tortispora caseinolytica NRRL Y-17796]